MAKHRIARLIHGVEHYENFPVASRLVPARLRPPVVAIYRFARHADDIADEGDAEPAQRIARLQELREAIRHGRRAPPVVAEVLAMAETWKLPRAPLLALLDAFEQDVAAVRHEDRNSLLAYCRNSANPVGELVLRLFECWNSDTRAASDAICSGLQLVNFLQDVASDWQRDRLYLPLAALAAHDLDADAVGAAVARGHAGQALARVIAAEADFARGQLCAGAALLEHVPLRLALELRMILAGGHCILDRLADSGYDPIVGRPRLHWRDARRLLALAASVHRLPACRQGRLGATTSP